MAWATDQEVKDALAAALKKDAALLPAYVNGIVAASVETAHRQIIDTLLPRGFTTAQILTWASLHSFHRHQSLYWAEVELREAHKDAEGELHGRKNRLAELIALALYDEDGTEIIPDEGDPAAGGVGYGMLADRAAFNTAAAAERTRRGAADWMYRR